MSKNMRDTQKTEGSKMSKNMRVTQKTEDYDLSCARDQQCLMTFFLFYSTA